MIVYELDRWSQDLSADFTLKDCLFRVVELKKNAVRYKNLYSGYGKNFTEFDSRSLFSVFQILITVKMLLFLHQAILHQFIQIMGITKPCTHLHSAPPSSIHFHTAHFNLRPAPSTCTQLILASTQLSGTLSIMLQPKYRT